MNNNPVNRHMPPHPQQPNSRSRLPHLHHRPPLHPLNQPPRPTTIDYGTHPFVVDINKATLNNENFRTTLWTGNNLQLTLMRIGVGEDIGLEMHPHVDQFLRIEDGQALVMMGKDANHLNFRQPVFDDFAIFIPAGTWHNIINTGKSPLKLYSIYAPPNHPKGAVHATKAIAEKMESH
ncbi:MAG: cupin domain-containing protein [Defluviitaleaceae bacterium]|nr:cupin domain-containing protein [Defluviitaleaceae bacterium]